MTKQATLAPAPHSQLTHFQPQISLLNQLHTRLRTQPSHTSDTPHTTNYASAESTTPLSVVEIATTAEPDGVSTTEELDGVSTTIDGVSTTTDRVSTTTDGVSTTTDGVSTTTDGVSTTTEEPAEVKTTTEPEPTETTEPEPVVTLSAKLSRKERKEILDLHNNLRGKVKPSASNMQRMVRIQEGQVRGDS